MKKFLVFLVSIVVVVSLGLTTYYFLRNDEVISIKTKEIFCNTGDTFSVDSLGITRKKPHHKTEFDYNAGGEAINNAISYNAESNCYVVSSVAKGDITLVIGTNNKKYSKFEIVVHVGNGSEENPYYVFGESELNKIGRVYDLNANYVLMNNVALSSEFNPIGFNTNSNSWVGFSGKFDGNGYSISGMNLNGAYSNAGLFSTINAGAEVRDLTIANATISGSYAYAGALAGVISGSVENVLVENATIVNTNNANITGAFAGLYNGTKLQVSAVESANINVSNTDSAIIGGFVGKVDVATIQATYANDVTITTGENMQAVGGFVGEFVITSENGSIQQSYANTSSNATNYGAFVGKITESGTGFGVVSTMLRHLIGNIAIKANDTEIVDTDLVASFNNSYFVVLNDEYTNRAVFYNPEASLYMVRGFASVSDAVNANSYIFYAVDKSNIKLWDTDYIWSISSARLPMLTMNNQDPSSPSGEYFMRDLDVTDTDEDNFNNVFSLDIVDANIKFSDAKTYELDNHTPINVVNSIIDGNGSTIRVNLANAKDGLLGLFGKIDNSTVKNLTIIVTNMSANATNGGALAGIITSSNDVSTSLVENVNVVFEGGITSAEISNFGGLAGFIEKTNVNKVQVSGVNLTSITNTLVAGGIVGINSAANIVDANINVTLAGKAKIGGMVGQNYGTIFNTAGHASISVFNISENRVGGIVAENFGTVDTVRMVINMSIQDATANVYAGGVAGENFGTISNTNIAGAGIFVAKAMSVTINIGGITAINNGSIANVKNVMENLGTYYENNNIRVGGVVVENKGTISQVIAGSNINGNIVAGVVVSMVTNGQNTIDQVLVANYNVETKAINENTIKGDKYVAGVVYEFSKGTISNIQAKSRIEGALNSTRSSLIALIFPSGANLNNATIDSAIVGAGTMYRESWTDYAAVMENDNDNTKYNIYDEPESAGIMKSVVINTSREGVNNTKKAMGIIHRFAIFIPIGNTYNGNSFVKYVENDAFNISNSFTGSFTFNCAYDDFYKYYNEETKTLTFDLSTVWTAGNGIVLSFVA